MNGMEEAISIYRARRARAAYPRGRCDGAGRWYPAESERKECCASIRNPSRRWRFSLLRHCCTAAHVAHLCNVDARELRRALKSAK